MPSFAKNFGQRAHRAHRDVNHALVLASRSEALGRSAFKSRFTSFRQALRPTGQIMASISGLAFRYHSTAILREEAFRAAAGAGRMRGLEASIRAAIASHPARKALASRLVPRDSTNPPTNSVNSSCSTSGGNSSSTFATALRGSGDMGIPPLAASFRGGTSHAQAVRMVASFGEVFGGFLNHAGASETPKSFLGGV